jgi:hypothetical protein
MKIGEPTIASFDWPCEGQGDEMRSELERNGVILARGFLDAATITHLRELLQAHFQTRGCHLGLGKVQPEAIGQVEGLDFIVTHPHVLALCRNIFPDAQALFTGHSDAHKNMLSGWHKDSGNDGSYFSEDCFVAPDCRVYKIGLYLQDHVDRHGLSVRPGSHRTRTVKAGPPVYIPTRSGDAVVFDVRLSHCGQVPDIFETCLARPAAFFRRIGLYKDDIKLATKTKEIYSQVMGRPDKLSLFFTFGAPNRHTADFSRTNAARQKAQMSHI